MDEEAVNQEVCKQNIHIYCNTKASVENLRVAVGWFFFPRCVYLFFGL